MIRKAMIVTAILLQVGSGRGPSAVEIINKDFNTASNRALLYAGAPGADPKVMREMRRRYTDALKSVNQLDHNPREPNYSIARASVSNFVTYVDHHPPGIIVPPVEKSSD